MSAEIQNNQAYECFITRRSCRSFADRMPQRELIEAVVKAGTYAPTGHGKQSPIIIAVTNPQVREELRRLNASIINDMKRKNGEPTTDDAFDPFYGAPVILIVLTDMAVPTALYDGVCVMDNLLNAAHAVGLSSCWIHRAKEEFEIPECQALLSRLGIEGNYQGVGHCALGYAARPVPQAAPRKPSYIHWVE